MRQLVFVLFLLGAAAFAGDESPFLQADGTIDVPAAVKHFEDLYRAESSVASAELTVIRPRVVRSLRMDMWSKGSDKALVVIQNPVRERGTATLKVDKNLWNYLPRIKRTIRVPPSAMLGSWMGSDFTNDDLIKDATISTDYTYRLVGKSKEPAGWTIRFDAKPDLIGLWTRFDLVVSPDATIPLTATYYDRRGQVSRTITWDEIKTFDGRTVPSRMTIEPLDQEGHRTFILYFDIDYNADVPDKTFSLSELERSR